MDILKILEKKIDERTAEGLDGSFYVYDNEAVQMRFRTWMEKIPRVVPFYAMKCNDEERVLKTLADLGSGFDCASLNEMKRILELGVEPERIIFAHTVKRNSHLKFAAENNVNKVTFDCFEELKKIKATHPGAEAVLRIKYDSPDAVIRLGLKFGCDPESEAPALIKQCKELEVNLIGVSFHVGSSSKDFAVFEGALGSVRRVIDVAADFGFDLKFVDIGGGFLGPVNLLDNYAKSINFGIEKHFSDPSFRIISEPGRFLVDSALHLATPVVLKRVQPDGHIFYYIDEGMFLSFLQKVMNEAELNFKVIRKSLSKPTPQGTLSTIWGCSCNSVDKVIGDQMIPEIETGDWFVFLDMGAYTTTTATPFNGCELGEILSL